MRTTLNLPAELIDKAKKALKTKTKTETIVRALQETVRRGKVDALMGLRGKIPLHLDLRRTRERA